MFARIIVPLDGTHFAEAALEPARALARAFGSRIVVVRAVPAVGTPALAGGVVIPFERLDEADAYLHDVVEDLRMQRFDADFALHIAAPGAGIARAAELGHADLVVMSSHLRWKVDPASASSVTLDVLARTQTPILAWRTPIPAPASDEKGEGSVKRPAAFARLESPIIVPLDGSELAERALRMATTLAEVFGLPLLLVRAIEADASEAAKSDAEEYLGRVRSGLLRHGLGVATRVYRGRATGAIERAWREHDGSLIVLASRGHHRLNGALFGGVAAWLIDEVDAPVLVLRPEDAGEASVGAARPSAATDAEMARQP